MNVTIKLAICGKSVNRFKDSSYLVCIYLRNTKALIVVWLFWENLIESPDFLNIF